MGLDNKDCKGVVLGGMIEEVMKPFLDSSGGLEQVWRWRASLGSYGLVCLT